MARALRVKLDPIPEASTEGPRELAAVTLSLADLGKGSSKADPASAVAAKISFRLTLRQKVLSDDQVEQQDLGSLSGTVELRGGDAAPVFVVAPDSAETALVSSFDAEAAVRMGLVNKAVPLEALREETRHLAEHLCKLNPETLKATKQAIKAVRDMTVDQAHEYLMAKSGQLSFRDRENGYAQGIRQFIDDKTFRPGMGPYARSAS